MAERDLAQIEDWLLSSWSSKRILHTPYVHPHTSHEHYMSRHVGSAQKRTESPKAGVRDG